MSEAVEMIISADDQASKKFAQVAANAEKDLSKIKTAGEKLKGIAGAGGSLSSLLGGTELGGQISRIGELTEKVNQFGAVAKMGGSAANLFRGGVAALVAVMSFELGQSIGNVVFGVEKTRQQFEKAAAAAKHFQTQILAMRESAFSSQMADISIVGDPQKQEQELRNLFGSLEQQSQAYVTSWREAQSRADKLRKSFDITDLAKDNANAAQLEANSYVDQINQLRQQQTSIKQLIEGKARSLQSAFETSLDALNRERILLTEGASAAEKFSMRQQGLTDTQIEWIEESRKYNEELKQQQQENEKAAQQAAKVSDAYANAASSIQKQRIAFEEGTQAAREFELIQQGMSDAMAERIAEEEAHLRVSIAAQEQQKELAARAKDFNDQLKERRILLEQGEEAAKAFNLEQQGFDRATAAKMAREDAELRKAEQAKQQLAGMNTAFGPVEARESRTLSGRSASVENATKAQLQTLIEIHNAIIDQTKNNRVRLVQVNR